MVNGVGRKKMVTKAEYKNYRGLVRATSLRTKCYHCKEIISLEEDSYSINKYPMSVGKLEFTIDFHVRCFKEIAGKEYITEDF